MLDYAPPNSISQQNSLTFKKAALEQEAWSPAPGWLEKLRHSSTDTDAKFYETSSPGTDDPEYGTLKVHEEISPIHYPRTDENNEIASNTSLDPYERQVFTSHSSDEEDYSAIIQSLTPSTFPKTSTYVSHDDISEWDAQASNLKPYVPQIAIDYEGVGLVPTTFVRSDKATRRVRRKGKGLPEKKLESDSESSSDDEDDRADSVIGKEKKEVSRRWENGMVKPVSFASRIKAGVPRNQCSFSSSSHGKGSVGTLSD